MNDKENLLEETIEALTDNNKTIADVIWCGTAVVSMSWDEFAKLADGEYYSGYGSAEVNPGLLIVGDTWWLERGEYDGSEWWEYKQLPTRPPAGDITEVFI